MKKTIKGKKWKDGKPIKGILNELDCDRQIIFEEKETGDVVKINAMLKSGQYALYSEEYLPATLEKSGHKKADITLAMIDEDNQKLKYYVADAKSNIRGEDMIFKLCEQWKAGLKYVRDTILCNMEVLIEEEENIIVFTRKFDEEKIARMVQKREEELDDIVKNQNVGIAAAKLLMTKGAKIKKEYELLKLFSEKKFTYCDRYIKEEIHKFEVCKLVYNDGTGKYEYLLNVGV